MALSGTLYLIFVEIFELHDGRFIRCVLISPGMADDEKEKDSRSEDQ